MAGPVRAGQPCELGVMLGAIGLKAASKVRWALSRTALGVASPIRWRSSIQSEPGLSISNRSRAESSPPAGRLVARTALSSQVEPTLNSARRR